MPTLDDILNDPQGLARYLSQASIGADENEEDQSSDTSQATTFGPTTRSPDITPEEGSQSPSASQGQGGSWESFLQEPSNRAFLLNFGLQLMSGGWGGWGNQLARAIATGVQGARAEEQGAPLDNPTPGVGARRGSGVDRVRSLAGPRARTYRRLSGSEDLTEATQDAMERLTNAQQFLNRTDTTQAEWDQAVQPGGLLHNVGYTQATPDQRAQLIQDVQESIRRLHTLPRRGGRVSSTELLRLGQSQDPADQADFQILARQLLGSPGVGRTWRYNPETHQIEPGAAGPQGRGGGPGGGRFVAPQQAGVDSASVTIANLRDYVQNQGALTGYSSRALQQLLNSGPYAQLSRSMLGAVSSYMHARSGAQTSVREFEHYVEQFMPQVGDTEQRIMYKLAELEFQMLAIGRRGGESGLRDRMLALQNEMRRRSGVPEWTPEQFNQFFPLLPHEQQGSRPPTGGQQSPPVTPPPGTQPAPQGGQRPAWATDPPPNAPPRPGNDYFWHPGARVWLRQVQ